MKYFLYNQIPGSHPSWTLAVLAINQTDADAYMRRYNGGGKRAGSVERGGDVKADCGAVTHNAEIALSNSIENL